MKKRIAIITAALAPAIGAFAQSAVTAYDIAQPDLKGTARYMGMAGAFGALGGDLSAISQNPGGIGVYRSSDIGFTLDLDLQHTNSQAFGGSYDMNQTKFLLNNIGAVLTLKLPSSTFPNFNFGFTYNKGASFNRTYGGNINTLQNSMSNYIAGVANANDVTEGDVSYSDNINPYDPGYGYYTAPWLCTLGYNSYLITPEYDPMSDRYNWYGLWADYMDGTSTRGKGSFVMQEKGGTNDFNIVLGGNISNVVYWGMNFDIVNVNYTLNSYWGEQLDNALVPADNGGYVSTTADWNLNSLYHLWGTGFNYQLGFIVKPVQQLRFGFSFHTPTWYTLNEEFGGSVDYTYDGTVTGSETANNGYLGATSYNLRTPWRLMASAAGVIGDKLIVSFDYEWANYGTMHFSEPSYYGGYGYDWDYPWDWYYSKPGSAPTVMTKGPVSYDNYFNWNDPYGYENQDVKNYYKSSNTFRIGVEFKPLSWLSLRAGYSNVSSPVKYEAQSNKETIYTPSLSPSYRFDNKTNYVTCGLGFRYQHVYCDLAYVYKQMRSEYHAYTPDVDYPNIPSPQSRLTFTNNQIVLSAGYRF